MREYLIAAVVGAGLGLLLLVVRESGSTGGGLSPRDIAGGAVEVGLYVVLFVGGWAIRQRFSK